jgi:gas vesicle protein
MSKQSNVVSGLGVGLLFGAVLGASAALLHAPNSDKRTKRLAQEASEDAWDDVVDRIKIDQVNERWSKLEKCLAK